MAGSNASKGNPASKRMVNPRLKEKRAASWARGQKRKVLRRTANDARKVANIEALGDGYVKSATRTVTWIDRQWVGGKLEVRERSRQVSLSPSKQKRRAARRLRFNN